MRVVSNKLLILMAASVVKTSTFTVSDLADQTIETFKDRFGSDDVTKSLRASIHSMRKDGLIVQIGEQEAVADDGRRHRPAMIFCFTDAGRKERLESSKMLKKVLAEISRTVESDLSNVTEMKLRSRKKKAA